MKGGKTPKGYTIVEVMIVLAVSGVMFIIASTFISGKQQQTAFTQGVNDLASNLQHVVEQVNGGQYSDIPLNCSYSPSQGVNFDPPPSPPPSGASGGFQGQNPQCVYLGKVLHFTEAGAGGDPAQQYEVFSLAGRRKDDADHPITNVANADPTPIVDAGAGVDLTTQETVPQHLDITKITVTKSDGSTDSGSYGIGILQGMGPADDSGALLTGTQASVLYYVDQLGPGVDKSQALSKINAGHLLPASRVDMCVSDGQRKAVVSFGANGNQLNVTADLSGNTPGC